MIMMTATVSPLSSGRSAARRARGNLWRALLALVLAAGCGGGKHADTTPAGGEVGEGGTAGNQGAEMVPPEKMDEVTRSLDRKRQVVSRCLANAVDNKELPKNSAGKVTLELVIGTSGKAESVKVVRATLDSKTLNECVISHVKEIDFPELPKPYETSYTYGFEAM
jgi:hypothetical protein